MSDREDDNGRRYSSSPSPERHKSRSRSYSKSRSRSYSPRKRSYSPKRRKRSYSRSYSRSRSRSGSYNKRYRSRSRSPYYRNKRRSYSPKHRGRNSRSPMSNRRRHTGNRFNPSVNNVIGVFGLSLYTTEKDLKEVFDRYGSIREVKVVYDHQTGKSRGFAFLYFDDIDDAVEAKEHCNGIELDGRKIRVDYSITKRPHTPTPGIYMGKPTRYENDGRWREANGPARSERDRDRYDDDEDRYSSGRHSGSRY